MFWSGKFIVLEGCEGAGKTHQTVALTNFLTAEGYRVLTTREPGGRPGVDVGIGQIRSLLVEKGNDWDPVTELLLFAAARREHVERVIRPALADGMIVVCDRFSDSTLAYQGYGRGLGVALCNQLRDLACGDIRPDLTLVIDIPADVGLRRSLKRAGDADRFEQESLIFHEKVREAFLSFALSDPRRYSIIDGGMSIEQVEFYIQWALRRFSDYQVDNVP